MTKKKALLGYTKEKYYGSREPVFLYNFKWDCGRYYAGGYIGNKNFHARFNGAFLDVVDIRGHVLGNFFTPWHHIPEHVKNYKVINNGAAIWENITFFLDDVPEHIKDNWWRIKDLFKQFYTLKECAEVFQYGGHCCTPKDRNPKEINKDMADKINKHIETVIIPEIRKIFNFK